MGQRLRTAAALFHRPVSLAGICLAMPGPALAMGEIAADVQAYPWLALPGGLFAGLLVGAGGVTLFSRKLRESRNGRAACAPEPADARTPLEVALDAAGLGFWDLDPATGEFSCDPRARALLGLPDGPKHARADWLERVDPADQAAALRFGQEALASGRPRMVEYRVVTHEGETRWIEDCAQAFTAPDGTHRLIGLMRDITRRHVATEELGARRSRAQEAAEEKGRFLAVMSHEIRTPMTGILGMLELLAEDPESEKRTERLGIARRSARSLMAILDDILAFSRLEAGKFELRPEPTRPRRLVSEIMALMAPRAGAKGIALRWTIAPETPEWVLADANRARQVLLNIVSNAIKFTETGQVVTRVYPLRSDTSDTMTLRFDVEDTGAGIAPEMLHRVFESFVRDESGEEGTGLGLAIAKHLTQLMGGTIEMASTVGTGTRVRLDIPVGAVQAAPEDTREAAPEPPGPMRILVAEDNSTNQYLLRALLEREGHHVTMVSDGTEAVRAAKAGGFDVVLMDVQMPIMDGTAATREIRAAKSACADIPIIALTANALAGDKQIYLAAGMNDYVPKPIEFDALNRVLARVSNAHKPRGAAVE